MRIMYKTNFFLESWLKKGNPSILILILFFIVSCAGCISHPANYNMTTTPTTFPTPVINPYPYATIEEARSGYPDYIIPEYLPESYIFAGAYYFNGPDERIDTYFSPSGDIHRQPPPVQDVRLHLIQHQNPTPLCSGGITGESVIVEINGHEGMFIQGSRLSWYSGNYSFCLVGPFNLSEIVKIAESVSVPG